MSGDVQQASQMAAGLRQVADFVEQNPDLAGGFEHTLVTTGMNVHLRADDRAAQLGQYAQAAARHGAKVTKEVDDQWHNVVLDFGGVKVRVLAYRSEVCERVVTGTETVTKSVPDPDVLATVPTVEVTEIVETVEWVCKPLLAADAAKTPAV